MNQTIEFNKIIERLKEYALSEGAKQKFDALSPYLKEREVIRATKETSEGRQMLDSLGSPPFDTMREIEAILDLAKKGGMLIPEQLEQVRQFAAASKRMKEYLKKGQFLETEISAYEGSMDDLIFLREEITLAIRNNRVDDNASNELKNTRRKIEQTNTLIKTKMEALLRNKKEMFSDSYVSTRNGHFVLPVKKEYKLQIAGSVIDCSATGATYFIEPTVVSRLQEELSMWKIQESNEERKILYTLTGLVCDCATMIELNVDAMETLDFIFAKAKLSYDMDGIAAHLNRNRGISIEKGKHPLLNPKECVPLDFTMGDDIRGIIITGPNTGGKTVALKTVGLFCAMAQAGLHLPCKSASICMNNVILSDIGDGQSITENLSTFSAHITNIISILKNTNEESLILLDELGSGTDPAEGMGIAIAILEELRKKGCLFLATTHYPEVKDYALKAEGLINARMAFDRESLKPLYQLEIGEAGESCALYIAKRLGMPGHMLETAYHAAYEGNKMTTKIEMDPGFLKDAATDIKNSNPGNIQREVAEKIEGSQVFRFNIGDSVLVSPDDKIGIVYQLANERGEVGVMVHKIKQLVNHKRLKLKAPASELYPEDYDFSVIFDSVQTRKARNKMGKHHTPGLELKIEKEL